MTVLPMWAAALNPTNILTTANVKNFSCFLLQFRDNKLLNEYKQKRNFDRTPEPEGKTENSKDQPRFEDQLRFVVQHHMARKDHYDLRLEWDGALLSWAVPKGPSYNTHDKRLAVQVEDHPLEYRSFEGTIPKGEYGGGVVMLWDEGLWEPHGNVEEGLREGALKFVLNGKRLKGKWALVRLKAKAGETKDNWLFLKEKDEYVKTDTGISSFITSIRTGRTMAEIETGEDSKITRNPFDKADVQLAKLVNTVPDGEDWLYELKYDGYRMMAFVENNSVRLITRNGNDYTRRFHDIATSLINLAAGRAMVLDGEMAITDASGKTDFQALQNYMKNPKAQNLTYIVFDLLALDGVDLRGRHLIDRKEMLEALMKDAPKSLYYSRHVRENGKESFIAACEAGMEGIVGKKSDSIYSGTRNGDWIKLKCDKRQEFVIGGYMLSDKKTSGVSSLLLGIYEGEELIYTGRAGTGLSKRNMRELEIKFESLHKAESPFKIAPNPRSNEKITWLEPELVAEIKFAEWTEEKL
ncbi:MAG: non-homologous end-joining DNA ligase, partial [Smithella sp.]